jgi:hypothetical protein
LRTPRPFSTSLRVDLCRHKYLIKPPVSRRPTDSISVQWKRKQATNYQDQICNIVSHDLKSSSYPALQDEIIKAAQLTKMERTMPNERIQHKPWYTVDCHKARSKLQLALAKAKQSQWEDEPNKLFLKTKHEYKATPQQQNESMELPKRRTQHCYQPPDLLESY